MTAPRILTPHKRIALVAHDHQKEELLSWAEQNRAELSRHQLFATGTTGKMLIARLRLPVELLLSGPLGGDQQVGALIAEQRLDMLIFFWDPLQAQPHDPDVKALLRLGVLCNIPLANNRTTADFLFSSPLMAQDYPVTPADHTVYLNRMQ